MQTQQQITPSTKSDHATSLDRFKATEEKREKQPDQSSLEDQLTRLVEKLYRMGSESRRRRHYIWAQADLFSKGIHFFWCDARDGSFHEWDKEDQDLYTPVPLVQNAVEIIKSQYGKSRPKLVPRSERTDAKTKTVLRELQTVADTLMSEFYSRDPAEKQREATLCPLRDAVFILLELDKSGGEEISVPEYGEKQVGLCLDCGMEVEGDGDDSGMAMGGGDNLEELGQSGLSEQALPVQSAAGTNGQGDSLACPHCGSPNVKEVTSAQMSGYAKGRKGKIKRTVVDAFQIDVLDRAFSIKQSPWLIYDQLLFVGEAKRRFPYVTIKGAGYLGNKDEGFNGLHTLKQIETLVTNSGQMDQSQPDILTSYGGAYTDEMRCVYRQSWIRTYMYDEIVLPRDTQLPGTNKIVPAGTKLIEMFPDGLLLHFINGKIVKMENDAIDPSWIEYRYSVPGSGKYGVGIGPLISLNKAFDELTSIQLQAALMSSLGITLHDERIKGMRNKPGEKYAVPQELMMFDKPLSNFVQHIATPWQSGEIEMMRQSFKENVVDLSMAPNPNTSGITPDGMGTATGVRYQAATVNAITAPKLELFAAACAETVEKSVRKMKKMIGSAIFFSGQGATSGVWLDPMEIPDDIWFEVEQESYQPKTTEDRRNDIAGALGLGVGQGKIMNPAIEDQAIAAFGLSKDVDTYDEWSVKAEMRLDRMRELVPQFEQMAQVVGQATEEIDPDELDEETAMGVATFDPVMELITAAKAMPRPLDKNGNLMYARFYNDFYLTDEFEQSPELLQLAVERLFQLHQDAVAQEQANDMQRQMAAAAPVEEKMAEEQAMAEGKEQEGRQSEEQSKAGEREHQAGEAERGRQHEMEMESVRQMGAKDIAGMKAKEGGKKK